VPSRGQAYIERQGHFRGQKAQTILGPFGCMIGTFHHSLKHVLPHFPKQRASATKDPMFLFIHSCSFASLWHAIMAWHCLSVHEGFSRSQAASVIHKMASKQLQHLLSL
jgi:hypothetical protein